MQKIGFSLVQLITEEGQEAEVVMATNDFKLKLSTEKVKKK
jgi:hypothetical protein